MEHEKPHSAEPSLRRDSIPIDGRLDDRRNVKKEPKPFDELPPEIQRLLIGKDNGKGSEESTLDKLCSKHVLTTLMYVAKMSPVMKSDIYSNVSRCSNMAEKIDILYSFGLIDIYYAARTRSNIIVITPKGKQVAEVIDEIISIIDGESSSII